MSSPESMPPKKRQRQAETEKLNKRYRQAIDELAEEYVCPITAELPIDPVTAEDGRCYERRAIEEWFNRQPQPQVKSPVTNEPMGKRLFPAVQLRNSLKQLVESGAISGSKADAWKKAVANEKVEVAARSKAAEEAACQRKADRKEVAALRQKAEGGDAGSMRNLGGWYREGLHGLQTDAAQAFAWFKRAADLDQPICLTLCGHAYLHGEGVDCNISRGFIMLGRAAELGDEQACYMLGMFNAYGQHGLEEDPQEAKRWFRLFAERAAQHHFVLSSPDEETHKLQRDQATAWLREHP